MKSNIAKTIEARDVMISEIEDKLKFQQAGRQTVIKGTWGSRCLSTDGIRISSNAISRGTGPTGAQQDRAWEIAKGLRPAPRQKGMAKAA